MALNDMLESSFKVLESKRTADAIMHSDVIGARVLEELLEEPKTLLGKGQKAATFDIGTNRCVFLPIGFTSDLRRVGAVSKREGFILGWEGR